MFNQRDAVIARRRAIALEGCGATVLFASGSLQYLETEFLAILDGLAELP